MWGELAPPTAPQERLCHRPPKSACAMAGLIP
jgi:hypothetical protein